MGHVVPLLESEMANVIPMWMDAPADEPPHAPQHIEDRPAVSGLPNDMILYMYPDGGAILYSIYFFLFF